MAYDKDSDIGKQIANPGNPNIGQINVYEQKITSVPVLESKISSIPVLDSKNTSIPVIESKQTSLPILESKTTSIPVIENKTTSLPVLESKVTSIPVLENKVTSIPVIESKVSSMPLQNTARQIDMLSVEQFGHNQSVLRKNLSILEANSVNTDKEYGVMQVEDVFEFTGLTEESIIDLSNSAIELLTRGSASATVAESENLEGITKNNELTIETTTRTILLPHLSVVNGKKIYGLNVSTLGTPKFKSQSYEILPILDGNLNSNNIVTKPNEELAFTHGGSGIIVGQFSMTLAIDDTETDYEIYGKVFAGNGSTVVEDSTATLHSGGSDTATIGIFPFRDNMSAALYIRKSVGGVYGTLYEIPIYINITDSYQDTFIERFTIDGSGFYNKDIPQCSLVFTALYSDEISETKSWRYSKSSSVARESLRFVEDIVNVFDWTYYNYAMGYEFYSTKSVNCTSIKNTGLNYFIIGSSPDTILGFTINTNTRSKFTSYVNMVDISNELSIGIIKRINGSLQIGCKWLNSSGSFSYITAMNDSTYINSEFKLSNLSIISTIKNGVSFTIAINGKTKYYTIAPLEEIEGNKLITGSSSILMMNSLDVENQNLRESMSIKSLTSLAPSVSTKLIAVDDNVYVNVSNNFDIDMSVKGTEEAPIAVPTTMILSSSFGLRNSIIQYRYGGDFVSDNLCLYLPCGMGYSMYESFNSDDQVVSMSSASNTTFRHIAQINSYDLALGAFSALPLRMEDEYPDVSSNSKIYNKSITMGKSTFVSTNGELYGSGSLFLCRNNKAPLIYEVGATAYFCTQYLFLAKSSLTNIYQFTELGIQLTMTVEDEIICNPVMSSVGIVMCGKTGIWVLTKDGVIKVWKSISPILQASLKTDLDNSCIAILDNSAVGVSSKIFVNGVGYITIGGAYLSTATINFTTVTINQLGNVSSQATFSTINEAEFIDIGPTAELLIIDLENERMIQYLDKSDDIQFTTYSLQSNQNIEVNEQTIYSELVAIKVFAMGSGTIDLYINGTKHDTVELSSVTRYTEYKLNVSHVAMQMIDYKFVVDNGVKMLQRIVGIIIPKEEYYG